MISWTRLVAWSITLTVRSRRLAIQTLPPPPATAAGSVPTETALTVS
jgi:hypothetical protein